MTTTTTRAQALANAAAARLGYTAAELRGGARDEAAVRARQLAALALLELGESCTATGRALRRDHSTISYHRQHADMGTLAEARQLARAIDPDRPPPLEVLLREALATAERLEAQARELRRMVEEAGHGG